MAVVDGSTSLSNLTSNGLGGGVQQYVSGSAGMFDFALNGGYQRIGGSFDAKGNRRAPEPSQGDLFDSDVWNIGGKTGVRLGDGVYLQLSAFHYRAEQKTDFAADPAPGRWHRAPGSERAANATASQPMSGYRIPPLKLTAYVEISATGRWDIRFQGLLSGDRDYRLNGVVSFGRRNVEQYTTFDLVSRYRVTDKDSVTVDIENLFNQYYLPVYSQLLRNNLNTSRVPANGATLTASYRCIR